MSNIPFFFENIDFKNNSTHNLSNESAKHAVQVLRMKEADTMVLNNGNGQSSTAKIISIDKKKCTVQLDNVILHQKPKFGLHLAIAFTRNTSRNEWLLEKATELGVLSITPLISQRTIREKYREDRWKNILVSAMLQSQQYFLPELKPAIKLDLLLKEQNDHCQKLIAHCDISFDRTPISYAIKSQKDTLILIGPEGDFSPEEIKMSLQNDYTGIFLCTQRLRTETAAMAVCAYYNLLNQQ